MKMNEGCCEMCGHHVALRQKAHIVAENDKSSENILLLCPSCHVLFDHQLKPRLHRALTRAGVTGLPASWATSHYAQAGAAGWRRLQAKASSDESSLAPLPLEAVVPGPAGPRLRDPATEEAGVIYSQDQMEQLLESVAGRPGRATYAALVPQVGSAFASSRALMVVGRVTNGWGEPEEGSNTQFTLNEIVDPTVCRGFAERTLGFVDDEPLAWVNEYGPRSAFWRVARRVAEGLDLAGEHWYRQVAWSNLYKVAPADAGNPSDALMQAQQAVCIQLLRHELAVLRPRRVLFLVGCGVEADWFQWFEQPLEFVEAGRGEVAGQTLRWGRIAQAEVVVLPHPQGKPESKLAEAALQRFRAREQGEVPACG